MEWINFVLDMFRQTYIAHFANINLVVGWPRESMCQRIAVIFIVKGSAIPAEQTKDLYKLEDKDKNIMMGKKLSARFSARDVSSLLYIYIFLEPRILGHWPENCSKVLSSMAPPPP